jgi:toxin ParE1/3/4
MAQIIWTEPALNELDEIAEYITIDNFQAAQRLVHSVFKRVEQLKDHPKSGRKASELPRNSIYREVIVGPCRVFYRIEGSKIIIIYVMRSERVLRKFILEGRANLSS